jgi:hypothetical protein
LLLAVPVFGQESAQNQSATPEKKENTWGRYNVKEALEFGGRVAEIDGSGPLWSSYVTLYSGPRLLEAALGLHAPQHNGMLFDDLSLSTFGYGGDPKTVARLRILKGKWYRFDADLRRDKSFFDYDLLANPLNPSNSNPNIPVLDSPHQWALTRRMTDLNLQLFSVSPIRLHFGYGHGIQEGTSLTSTHFGTDPLLLQPWKTLQDNYTAGISWRPMRELNLNFDHFFTHFKNDTSRTLATIGPFMFTLPNGQAVNFGLPFNTPAGQPCVTPILNGAANPVCNGVLAFNQFTPIRSDIPNDQFSFQGNWKHLDIAGRVNYSAAEADRPNFLETFSGEILRTQQARYMTTGPAKSRRVSASADYDVTVHLTDKLHVVEGFRWAAFRIPGGWTLSTNSLFTTSLTTPPNVFSSAVCPGPDFNASTCSQHTAASGPDVLDQVFSNFVGQNSKINTAELQYDFSQKAGIRFGHRFEVRRIAFRAADSETQQYFPLLTQRGACIGKPTDPVTGICTVKTSNFENDRVSINANSGLFGFWLRPNDQWRFNFDGEIFRADNVFTRISPRAMELFRLRTTYKPKDSVNIVFHANLQHDSNDQSNVNHDQHNRTYAFDTSLAPSDRWGVDLSYSFNDLFSQTNICFVSTPTPTIQTGCSGVPFLFGLSTYKDNTHYGSFNVRFKPVRRVQAIVGYTVTASNGNTLILNPAAPVGPLTFMYHLPVIGVAVDVREHWTWKAGWNYYNYNEASAPGPTAPRDFRGNVVTILLRYSK